MRTKVGVLVNIFYTEEDGDGDGYEVLQFDRKLLEDNCCKIAIFLKDCPYITHNIDVEDFGNLKVISVKCDYYDAAYCVLQGLICLATKLEKSEDENSIESDIYYITHNLDIDDLFLQMAEEAAELSQACLKYVRAHKGNNPTKDSEDVYLKGIIEEFTDVQVCAEAIDITADSDIHDSKIHRWADRIRKKNGGSAK